MKIKVVRERSAHTTNNGHSCPAAREWSVDLVSKEVSEAKKRQC